MDAELADEIGKLSRRVRRLLPSARDPEAFHIEKDEIARTLQRIAVSLDVRQSVRVTRVEHRVTVNGHSVTVQRRFRKTVATQPPRPSFAV